MSKDNEVTSDKKTEARRDFMKKTAYIAPVIMTMGVVPSVAAVGSDELRPLPTPD